MNPNLKEALMQSTTMITRQNKHMQHKNIRIMAFDTETSGLLPKTEQNKVNKLSDFPYILQLGYVIYDINQDCIVKEYNECINVSEKVVISQFITDLTGITKEMCKRGVEITDALVDFYLAYMSVDYVVAHNIGFDTRMIELELQRNMIELSIRMPHAAFLFNDTYNLIQNITLQCTMQIGKKFCDTYMQGDSGKTWKKPPRLGELHKQLFGFEPKKLHNSLVDSKVAMKCYLKMVFDKTLLFDDILPDDLV
jgi:DNA polymerase III epsilon subunit-like protein